MVKILIGIVVCLWIYKLAKIIQNSKELNAFSKECLELAKKGSVISTQYKLGAEQYKKANRKITISKLIWFFIEVGSLVTLYFIFFRFA
ncbi:hypothetical protein FVB32_06605 [Flagellimonas hymeniacidonis]|uniref:Uncharacterized protein n=1 Tax=Flagellimonas hymeniacidonis TaxID=2603628 RepID=A0A5C8V972_9FLAO|nr:hypothetical protein [Flagellimonas hymeniacidonis]TXN37956.1 hypothetical protein FVB32_06605 [Flagellimonas hymeniacidonis]